MATDTPFTEILAWARGQPLWQQQAVRMILATHAPVPKAAIPKLADLCVAEVAGEKVSVAPLADADLPLAGAAEHPVTLVGFGHVHNVNALKADQWIAVGPKLTIVYGANATGKTGYARVLKKAFRARVVEEVQPDVRAATPTAGPAETTFEFKKAAAPAVKVVWRSDQPLPAEVASRFAVLDGKSGHAYLVDNELQLAPQGLDVLPRLVEALDGVRAELAARRSALSIDPSFLEGVAPGTAAAATAQRITAATEPGDVLPSLAFTDEHAERLEAARDGLAQLRTPKQAMPQLEAAARAAQTLKLALDVRQRLVGPDAVQEVLQMREEAVTAAAVAKKVESLAADQKLVKGVGSEAWETLVQAASDFAAENELKGRCPLCLEKLEDAAEARVARFFQTVTGEAADQRVAADAALNERLDQLAEIASDKDPALEALVAVVEPHARLLAMGFSAAMASSATTAKKLRAKKPAEGVDLSAARKEVDAAAAAIAAKLQALQKGSAGAVAEAQRLGQEVAELEARKLLSSRAPRIEAHVKALRAAQRLELAQASVRSAAATHQSAALNEKYLTESYRQNVEAELKRLGFARHAPVLTQQGAKGKVKVLALPNPKKKTVAPDAVFSEGERTVIAIASFFAELGLTATPVGVVFDDPIAALDHVMRAKVAARLVDAAAQRQVVVFTHDQAFRAELQQLARDAGTPVLTCELKSTPTEVGIVVQSA